MQIRINLLPPEIIARQEQKRKQQRLAAAGSLVLLLFIALYGLLMLVTIQTLDQVVVVRQQKEAMDKQAGDFKQFAELQAHKNKVEKIVNNATGNSPEWLEILEELGLQIPSDIWLESFTAKYKHEEKAAQPTKSSSIVQQAVADVQTQVDKLKAPEEAPNGEVTIQGWAPDNQSVARWLEQMQTIPGLTEIRCSFSTGGVVSGQVQTRFEIKAMLQQKRQAPVGTKKAGD